LDGRVLLNVSLAVESSREATDAKSQMFEGLLLDLAPSEWMADPGATSDVTRFDGLVVHRKGYFKRQQGNIPRASSLKGVFETLAARNNVFLGVGLVYNLGIHDLIAEAMSCNQRNDCPASLDKIRLWAQAFACVELSTFSVG
jgi:hypothetical protein